MQAGLYIAYTGARLAERKIDQIANNLANVSSVGYKQDRTTQFGVAPVFSITEVGAATDEPTTSLGTNSLLYAAPGRQFVDFTAGPIRTTGSPYDLAIEGNAFFVVQDKNGVQRLTRGGNFQVDGDGDLASILGDKLLGAGGPIRVRTSQAGNVLVGQDGQVSVDGAATTRVQLVTVSDPSKLRKYEGNRFEIPAGMAMEPASANVIVQQGAYEESNVSAVLAMNEMIESSRMFEAYMKMMQTVSDLTGKTTNDLGRI